MSKASRQRWHARKEQAPKNQKPVDVECDYCQKPARFVTGAEIYPHRPDLHGKQFYKCTPCSAWVGCHPNTTQPLGRLANAALRKAKSAAHAAFDPLWKEGRKGDRARAYQWLARELAIDPTYCHIGMMDLDCCIKVAEVCAIAHKTEGFSFSMELT